MSGVMYGDHDIICYKNMMTKGVSWQFNCTGERALLHVQHFLNTYVHDGYALRFYDAVQQKVSFMVHDVKCRDIYDIIKFIYNRELSNLVVYIGVSVVSKSYYVCLPMCKHLYSGEYAYCERMLVKKS